MNSIHPYDLLAIFLYLCGVLIIAFRAKRKELVIEETAESVIASQYMANRSLTFTEAIGSIIATEVSALTFLGLPAYAFGQNFSFILIYVGAIIGRFIIARWMLPPLYAQGNTVYEVIAKKHQHPAQSQKIMAGIYSISKILAVGVRLYSGSILVAQFFNMNINLAVTIITFMTAFYTLIGGLKAVVRTDLLQALVFLAGGISAYYIIPEVSQISLSELWSLAVAHDKTDWYDHSRFQDLLIGIVGGILFDMATHGVDQDFAQRLMAAKSLKTGQRAIFFSSFCSILVGLLFLGVGALLWSYHQAFPPPQLIKNDYLFAHFITQHYPPFLKGLMLAGVMAATMSTLDSTINALSAVMCNDLFPGRNLEYVKRHLKIDTFIISMLLLLVAFWASQSDKVLELGLKIASWSAGALLAYFITFLLMPTKFRPDSRSWALILAYVVNLGFVYLNTFVIKGPWQLNVYWGCAACMLSLYCSARFAKKS